MLLRVVVALFATYAAFAQWPEDSSVRSALAQDWASTVAAKPTNGAGRVLRGHALLFLNHPEASCAFRNSADFVEWGTFAARLVSEHPTSAVARYFYADAMARRGDLAGAIEEFTAAIDLDGHFVSALNARGAVYAAQGRVDQALGDFLRAERLAPAFADPILNRAWLNLQRRQGIDAALALFDRAIKLAPQSVLARVGKTYVLVILDRDGESRRELQILSRMALGCVSPAVVEDLLALAAWAALRDEKDLLASNAPPGTTITRDLNSLLHGNVTVIPRLANAAANDAFQAKRISSALNHFAQTNPTFGSQIATAINSGISRTSQQGLPRLLVDTASGLSLRIGNPVVGLTFNAQQLGQNLINRITTQNRGFLSLQNSFKPAQQQIGGVDTSFAHRHFERGDFPILVHYVLAYPRQGKEAL